MELGRCGSIPRAKLPNIRVIGDVTFGAMLAHKVDKAMNFTPPPSLAVVLKTMGYKVLFS